MDELKQYLLRVIAAALICSLVQTFQQKGTAHTLTRLICGVILTVTIISPFQRFSFPDYEHFPFSFSETARQSAATGEKMSRNASAVIIKEETEAYIQDKAEELGAQIRAEITLSEDDFPIPVSVVIRGSPAEHIRGRLQRILETDVGIEKENITWIG